MFQKQYWERKSLASRRAPNHPVITAYALSKISYLNQYIKITPQTKLLDVGCGNGFFTYHFDKICDTYGVDYSQKMLKMNPVKKTYLMDANQLKFKKNHFDVVFCHALLHHVDNFDQVLSEMKRVSKKYVVFLEPNRNNPMIFLFSLLTKEERKALKFSLAFLKKKAQKQNLKIIASFSQGMIVPNKTPGFFLPLLKLFDFKQSLGITNFVICKKARKWPLTFLDNIFRAK